MLLRNRELHCCVKKSSPLDPSVRQRKRLQMNDFMLPPRCKWDIRSSGMLRSVDRWLITDVSGQHMGPSFTVREEWELLSPTGHPVSVNTAYRYTSVGSGSGGTVHLASRRHHGVSGRLFEKNLRSGGSWGFMCIPHAELQLLSVELVAVHGNFTANTA
jgi:hypothetical protein